MPPHPPPPHPTDVVGLEDGLGVECLSGSGAIAGIYTRAFREGFTITLVSGRTVGIGAYLARLGRRCAGGRAPLGTCCPTADLETSHCHFPPPWLPQNLIIWRLVR